MEGSTPARTRAVTPPMARDAFLGEVEGRARVMEGSTPAGADARGLPADGTDHRLEHRQRWLERVAHLPR